MTKEAQDPTKKILIVDDSECSRTIIRRYIEKHLGCLVLCAENGQDALKAVLDNDVLLILMDMEMPIMNGYAATRIIRNTPRGSRIPIIAMSSHTGPDEVRKCQEAGCSGYLPKPFHKEALLKEIARQLQIARCA